MSENNLQKPCLGCGSTDYESAHVRSGTGNYCGKCPISHKLKSELESRVFYQGSVPYTSFSGGVL